MKILIMAQGQQRRLDGLIDGPKQFIEILGEPMVARAVRLARQHGARDITAVAPDAEPWRSFCASHGLRRSTLPDPGTCILDGLHHARDLWDPGGRTVILLGDVVYSRQAMAALLADGRPIGFVGRPTPSRVTGCPHGELFGLGFEPAAAPTLAALLADPAFRHQEVFPGKFGLMWGLYFALAGTRYVRTDLFQIVDDATDDIDDARDLASLPLLVDALRAEESGVPDPGAPHPFGGVVTIGPSGVRVIRAGGTIGPHDS